MSVGESANISSVQPLFPRNLLRKIEPRTSVPHNVTCLPPPDSGQELVVVLWIAEKSLDTGTGWPGCKVGATLLFRTDLPSGCSLFVTGEYRPRTEVKLPIPKEHRRNFGIAIRDNPLSTLVIHGETDRGVISMVETASLHLQNLVPALIYSEEPKWFRIAAAGMFRLWQSVLRLRYRV